MRLDFPELETLNARVRRERAEAIYTFVIAPLAKLFTHKADTRRVRARHRRLPG